MTVRSWVVLSAILFVDAFAGQPPSPPPPQPPAPPTDVPGDAAPDDEFLEFLGSDDVGDATWWEFLKKTAPRSEPPPAPPPQDARQ